MTDLIAPAHLRGRMPRSKPEALRSERISWAAKVSRDPRHETAPRHRGLIGGHVDRSGGCDVEAAE